ncbi:MAG: tetratricopeptide repeat protein [Verrucomicrobia bacterium]|nr:tetratricopeptide repeat protein [Verrucomicrobiota bacterium]
MPEDDDQDTPRRDFAVEAATLLTDADRARIDAFRSKHATELLVIVFTDLVGSAALKSELGDEPYKDLDDEHRRLLLETLKGFSKAQAIRVEGDSYIFAFLKPSDAVKFVLEAQAVHRTARAADWPRLPEFRVGIHLGTVVVEEGLHGPSVPGAIGDIKGLQADMTARIMGLAEGGQVLCSRAVFDDARQALKGADLEGLGRLGWVSHGPYLLKGREDPLEVCEVGEEAVASFTKPPGNEKARPAGVSDEELGWRPGVGVVVPSTDWELSEKLGEGEFGEVWLGHNRTTGERQVYKFCFKRERVAWLKREARLLGELRRRLPGHPNLVAFRDIMTHEDRPPYYITMEYVEGPSLEAWLAANPPLRERLEIIAQVAAGLDAVHAEHIYHRDVKPSNILLAQRPDGSLQAKLSDFGLGTAEDQALLKSVYASRVEGLAGTWDYIAPELRKGQPASAQSDIYALGLTLYQIVVGDLRRPLASGWERQVESDVLREDIARCTDADPARRWPRARELATALRTHDQRVHQRVLEHERVLHHKRVVRFRIVTGISAAFAVVMFVLGSLAWLQRYEAVRQRAIAEQRRSEADEQRAIAEEQRDRAVWQKEIALSAVRKLTNEVPERLKDVPGTLAPLRELMESNVATIDEILTLEPDTPGAHYEKCANYLGIGKSWLQLGDSTKALGAFETAFAIARNLAATDAGGAKANAQLADCHEQLGDAYLRLGRSGEAKATYTASLEIRTKLAAAPDADAKTRRSVADSHTRLGGMYLSWGRPRESLAEYQAAFDIVEALAQADPENVELQRALGEAHNTFGDACVALSRSKDAVTAYQAGFKLTVETAPEGVERDKFLTAGYNRLGSVYFQLGDLDEALKAYELSLEVAQALATTYSESVVAKRGLAVVYNSLGDLYLAQKRNDDALEAYNTMVEIVMELAQADPASAEAQRDLAVCHNRLGEAYSAIGRADDAMKEYEAALEITRTLAEDSESLLAKRDLSVSYARVAGAYSSTGNAPEALEAMQKALSLAIELTRLDDTVLQWQEDVANNYGSTGDMHFRLGHAGEALEAFQHMLETAEGLTERGADETTLLGFKVVALSGMGDTYFGTGRTADALATYERMLAAAKKRVELSPDDAVAQQALVLAYIRLADACIAFGSKQKALEYFASYYEIAASRRPIEIENESYPYWAYMRLGDSALRFGRAEAARDAYQRMQAVAETFMAGGGNPIVQQWLAWSYERLGNAYEALGRAEEAEQARAKAKELLDALPQTATEDSESGGE